MPFKLMNETGTHPYTKEKSFLYSPPKNHFQEYERALDDYDKVLFLDPKYAAMV